MKLFGLSLILCAEVLNQSISNVAAFTLSPSQRLSTNFIVDGYLRSSTFLSSTHTETETEDAFSAFADSLDEDNLFTEDEEAANASSTWQESLEMLLDPNTPSAKRQILLSDLLNANDDIRSDVQNALKDRKVSSIKFAIHRRKISAFEHSFIIAHIFIYLSLLSISSSIRSIAS